MTTIHLIPCQFSPRVDNIADFAAGLRAIQRHGIPQTMHIHPEDIQLIEALTDSPLAGHSQAPSSPAPALHPSHLSPNDAPTSGWPVHRDYWSTRLTPEALVVFAQFFAADPSGTARTLDKMRAEAEGRLQAPAFPADSDFQLGPWPSTDFATPTPANQAVS